MSFQSYFLNCTHNEIEISSIWISGGSYLDKLNKKGINQLLCSLLTRGCEKYDNFALSEYLNSYGAELNYDTFEDGTLLSIKCLSEYHRKTNKILKLIVETPSLSEKEFSTCKKFLQNNILKSKENAFNITYDNWRKIVYLNHPYAFSTDGYLQDLNLISYKDICLEYKDFENREKFLLTNQISKNFINLDLLVFKKLKKEDLINDFQNKTTNSRKFINHYSKREQIIMMIGNKTCPHAHEDTLALKILESHLSFGMSSKLFELFREKNGLTYDSGIFYPSRKFDAPFFIYLSTSNKNSLKVFEILLNIWKNLITHELTEEELSFAKVKLKSFILHSNQTTEDIINRKIQLLAYNLNPNLDIELLDKMELISCEDILSVSQKYFKEPHISISGEKLTCKKIENSLLNNFIHQ